MYISNIEIENFRLFGAGKDAFRLGLKPGLTAIVGENDAGKTALIDALRIALGTRDQETLRLEVTDFHCGISGERAAEARICLTFSGLTKSNLSTFAEYLTYPEDPDSAPIFILTVIARRSTDETAVRRFMPIEWRTGEKADGPFLDAGARFLLQATYLRPLRDAERAMSAGRGSRLSQILQHTKEIKEHGAKFDPAGGSLPDPETLSVLGLGDYANHLIENAHGVKQTRQKLNDDYLQHLSFSGDPMDARVRISGHRDDGVRLRQLLEKLEVNLGSGALISDAHARGLGSNNLLFMACELLLLSAEAEGFPLLLIEEPEAHLHPQRQLRLMEFLQAQAAKKREDDQQIQIIVTTHSTSLASDVMLDNLVLIRDGRGFAMAEGSTKLSKSDYRFLQRFLDVTKANLFFARGVVIVEGDAENILVPIIAKLIGRDFKQYGVSVVNVGGVGLGRYARIFMREKPGDDGEISIPVACITDMDVMPNCAPEILGKVKAGEEIPTIKDSKRRWRVKDDFPGPALEGRRNEIATRATDQRVRTFVANEWTLEYDLAYFGLSSEVLGAAYLAAHDEKIIAGGVKGADISAEATKYHSKMVEEKQGREELCSHVYKPFAISNPVSKPIAAQYLSQHLEDAVKAGTLKAETLRAKLPPYLVEAIEHVTEPFEAASEEVEQGGGSPPGPEDAVEAV